MAAAAARASINQQNAQHSTGPRTPEGKDRARLNALRHGAYSRSALLPNENPAAYEALGARLTAAFRPYDDEQRSILQTVQDTQWRLDRVLSLEANLHAIGVRHHLEIMQRFFPAETPYALIDLARANAYADQSRTFEQFHRQETRLRRILDRAYTAYLDLVFHPDAVALPDPVTQTAAAGFVSQNPPLNESVMPHFIGPLADIKRKQWLRRQAKAQSASAAAA